MGFLADIASALARRQKAPPPGRLEYVGPVQTRASQVGRLIALMTGGRTVPERTRYSYETNARDGYELNPIVYRCIRLIAEGIKVMPVLVFEGENEAQDHPLASVLSEPNPGQTWGELIDAMVGHIHLAGEVFLEGVTLPRTGDLVEVYALRPDRVAVIKGEDGFPVAYDFEASTGTVRFDVRPRSFWPVLHIRNWHPREHWRGLPIVAPAAAPADEYSDAVTQNRSLIANAAMPSGALVYGPKEGSAKMTDDMFERLKLELADEHSGPRNAGKPMILEGGLDWKPMGMTPRDMMSVEARQAAARETALALGVPPMLLGLPGDNTYANYQEANLAFWRQTIWPLAVFLSEKLSMWVRPIYGAGVRVTFDQDKSPLAEAERAVRWERIRAADFLTVDEKRAELGFEPLPDGIGEHVLVAAGLAPLSDVLLSEDPADVAAAAYLEEGDPNDAQERD